eukprot:gene15638-18580_t
MADPALTVYRLENDDDFQLSFEAIKRFLGVNSDLDRFRYVYGRCEGQFRLYDRMYERDQITDYAVTDNIAILELLMTNGHRQPSGMIVVRYLDKVYRQKSKGREYALALAARANDANTYRWLIDHGIGDPLEAVVHVCRHGNHKLLDHLEANREAMKLSTFASSDLSFLKRVNSILQHHGIPAHPQLNLINAVDTGNPEIVAYISSLIVNWTQQEIRNTITFRAAQSGHLALLLEYLLPGANDDPRSTQLMVKAAGAGHLHIVSALHGLGFECTQIAMNEAALHGRYDVVQFLHTNETTPVPYTKALVFAACNGHTDIVEFLLAKDAAARPAARNNAAKNGAIEALLLLDWPQYPVSHQSIFALYNTGRIIDANWIVSQQPGTFNTTIQEYSTRVSSVASNKMEVRNNNNHQVLIKYLVQQGHHDLLKWILASKPVSIDINRAVSSLYSSLSANQFDAFRGILSDLDLTKEIVFGHVCSEYYALYSLSDKEVDLIAPSPRFIRSTVINGRTNLVKLIYSKGHKIPKSAILQATVNNHIDTIQYLNELWRQVSLVHRRLRVPAKRWDRVTCAKADVALLMYRIKWNMDFEMCFEAIAEFLRVNKDYDRFLWVYKRYEPQFRLYASTTTDCHVQHAYGSMIDNCVNGNPNILGYLVDSCGYARPTFKIVMGYLEQALANRDMDIDRASCYEHLKHLDGLATGQRNILDCDALAVAAKHNDTDLFRFLLGNRIGLSTYFDQSVTYACSNGNLEIIELLESINEIMGHSVYLTSTNLVFLERMYNKYKRWFRTYNYDRVHHAVECGDIAIVRFHQQSPALAWGLVDTRFLEHAAKAYVAGHMDLVLHFIQGHAGGDDLALMAACKFGRIDVARAILATQVEVQYTTLTQSFDNAAENGHEDIIKLLVSINSVCRGCTASTMDKAASAGHIGIVCFLNELEWPTCTNEALTKAAENGHYKVVEYLVHNRMECNLNEALERASHHLEITKFLLANGAVASQIAVDRAALAGSFETMTLMGWPARLHISYGALLQMYQGNYLVTAEYIVANQPRLITEPYHALYMKLAGIKGTGSTSVLEVVLAPTPNMSYVMEQLVIGGYLQTFKWILTHPTLSHDLDIVDLTLRLFGSLGGSEFSSVHEALATELARAPLTDSQEWHLMKESVQRGYAILVNVLLDRGVKVMQLNVRQAVTRGKFLEVVKVLVTRQCYIPKASILEATISNHIQVIRYLYPLQSASTQRTIDTLAKRHNHHELIRLLNQDRLDNAMVH